ncbi:MAG: hypothetical protein U9R57_17890 [Thermodesulfobacteriota bacterium]|nr:hypothetical protein [Thermodesulfobacteriota bacterium]
MKLDSRYIRKTYIYLAGTVGCVILFFLLIHLNPKSLYVLAGNASTDSFFYKYAMKRIVVIYDKDPDTVLDIVLKKYNVNDPHFYIDTVLLSIFADNVSIDALRKKIDIIGDIEDDIYVDSNVSLLIESIGISMISDKEVFLVDMLSRLNGNNNNRLGGVINYIVARTLFFLTGKTYEYRSGNNSNATVRLTDDIIETSAIPGAT